MPRDSALPLDCRHLSLLHSASQCLRNPVASPCSPAPGGLPGHRTDLTDDGSKLLLPQGRQVCPCPALGGQQGLLSHTTYPLPLIFTSCHLHQANLGCPTPTCQPHLMVTQTQSKEDTNLFGVGVGVGEGNGQTVQTLNHLWATEAWPRLDLTAHAA